MTMKKLNASGRGNDGLYQSDKALGRLFRNIEVSSLLQRWNLDDERLDGTFAVSSSTYLLDHLQPHGQQYKQHLPYQREVVKLYYEDEGGLANRYHSEGRSSSLSAAEVFLGCILIKNQHQSRNLDVARSLQTDYRDLVERVLQTAISAPECEEDNDGGEDEMDWDIVLDDYESDGDDESDDDAATIRSQAHSEYNYHVGASTEASWTEVEGGSTFSGGRTTTVSYPKELRKARHRYLTLYAFFAAAIEDGQGKEATAVSCPWVVYPRLLAAKKNWERLEILNR
jgi:hypothetical protein